jgi:hypothetical protein
MGRTAEAWIAVEKSLSRVLTDLLLTAEQRSLTFSEQASEDSLKKKLINCEEELNVYRNAASKDTTADAKKRVDEARNRLVAAEAEWSTFQYKIAQKYPVTEGQVFPLERIQQSIPRNTALVG